MSGFQGGAGDSIDDGLVDALLRNSSGTELATSANPLRTDPTGTTTQPVSAVALPLPAGASTEATLATRSSNYPEGSVVPGTAGTKSVLGGAIYNSTLPTLTDGQQAALQGDSNGRLRVSAAIVESSRNSYSAGSSGFTVATTPTDVFAIFGSASKIIKITRIEITGTTTAGSGISISATLVKRSSLNTGGTAVASLIVPHDSSNVAPTAVVKHYTANPTLGTSVGNLRAARMTMVNAASAQNFLVWDFGIRPSQSPILRSASECLCLNFGGTSITGNIISVNIEWTEE